MNAVDYRRAINGAESFDDILTIFCALNFVAGKFVFDGYLRRQEATKKVTDAIALLKTGSQDAEARYFALSQIDALVWNTNLSPVKKKAIISEYADTFKAMKKELFDHYSSKGSTVITEAGAQESFAEHARLGKECENLKAKLEAELEIIGAAYQPVITAAYNEHVKPIIDQMEKIQSEYQIAKVAVLARKPYEDTPNYLAEREAWIKSMNSLDSAFSEKNNAMAEESVKAIHAYVRPLEDEMYNKKRAKMSEIGAPSALRNKQNEIAKEIHRKVIDHLLSQSPVTEEQATEWITQNAIMNKSAVTKAKKAGYNPADAMKDLAEFYRITGGRIFRLAYTTTRNSRSMASPLSGNLYVGSSFGKKTFFHELAHLLENDSKLVACSQEFLTRRRESDRIYSLSSLTGNSGYKSDERAYKDNWIDPYVGKVYRDGVTEVFSMGMQALSSPEALLSLQEKDPEHLTLMLGVCLSKPYVDEDQKKKLQGEVKQKKATLQKSEDYLKELDKKVSKAGNFWDGSAKIEPYIKHGRSKPSWYTVTTDTGYVQYFNSEKSMKRTLYLWISHGKPDNGNFALGNLKYSLGKANSVLGETLLDALLNEPVPELPNKQG